MTQQDVPTGFRLVRMNSQVASWRLVKALQDLLTMDLAATLPLTYMHAMFQAPTLLPFPTNVPFSSTEALPAFQLHVLSSTHQAQHKRHLLQEALLDNPP